MSDVPDQLIALAEGARAELLYQYESLAPQTTKARLGVATTRMGGGVVLSMRNDPTHFWNKALGFGSVEPITSSLVGDIVEFYTSQNSPGAVIQIVPSAIPADWPQICASQGFTRDSDASEAVTLACRIKDFNHGHRALRVTPVGRDHADQWASITLRAFEMPEGDLSYMLASCVGHPDFRPVAAWDGDDMVATANLFIQGQVGLLNSGATLPTHRNRGAQSALLAARAEDAAIAGCRWLVSETHQPDPGTTNPSLNNLIRVGLRPIYAQQSWTWRPTSTCRRW